MKKSFLNQVTTSVTASQSIAFHAAVAALKTAKRPQYASQGARTLAQFVPLLRVAVENKLTDDETVIAFGSLPNNPLAHLTHASAKSYVMNARLEFGLRKNADKGTVRTAF
jgi:hypothetical protein